MIACGDVPGADPDGPSDEPQALTVTLAGGGSVRSAPGGIDCGTKCVAQFAAGSTVTLTATPDSGSAFLGWSGDCTGAAECTVTMDASRSLTATFAPHGSKRWIAQVGFSGDDSIDELVVAPDGHLIAAGTVDDGGGNDLYVIKYDKDTGEVIWKTLLDTPGAGESIGGLATDVAGNVYLAARLSGLGGTATYGAFTLTGDLTGNIAVLRLAADTGAVVWAKQWGGTGQDIPAAVAVSGEDVYVVGNTSSNPSTFDAKVLAGATNNGFIVRASAATGIAAEAKLVTGNLTLSGVAVNGTHVAVVGATRSAMSIDGACALTPSGAGDDAILLDLSSTTLLCQWQRNFGDFVSGNTASFSAVAPFPGGGWTVIGSFQGNILLAGSGASLTSRGGYDVVTGRFSETGAHQWSFRYGDTGFDVGYGIATTPEGNVILAGAFGPAITFGTTTLTGAMNTFVTRMSPGAAPIHEWAVGLGGDGYDLAEDVAVAPNGAVYVLSLFTGMTDLAGSALTSQGYDSWIAALVQ